MSAPFAIAVDAVSYVGSAVASYLIKEPPREVKVSGKIDLTTGFSELFGNPVLARSATVAASAG